MSQSFKWRVICDQCGRKRYSDEVQPRWDGMIVCRPSIDPGCWETRHPQDLIRAPKEDTSVPFSRPEAPDTFVSYTINCDTISELSINSTVAAPLIIWKGSSVSPVRVIDTVEVVCTWTIYG